MDFLPMADFRKCVAIYHGNYKVRRFSCLDQFLAMAFAQLCYRASLRDIEATLGPRQSSLYHMGFRSCVSRSTLADANEKRDFRIYADFARLLIQQARPLYAGEPLCADLDAAAYALDSTTIDLCMTLFPWAYNQQSKSAVKLHTLMNLRGNIPEFVHITGGKVHDLCLLDLLVPEPGAFYVMDRGYIDFARLASIHRAGAFFIVRAKRNLKARRRYSRPVDRVNGLRSDQTIALTYFESRRAYPEALRRIVSVDAQSGKRIVLITNNFTLNAATIAALYRERWQIEVFFKWIKQNLRIKSFYGTSPNAVKTQIWIAICVYVLVAVMKKQMGIQHSLYTILQILSARLFEKTLIRSVLSGDAAQIPEEQIRNQLTLFQI
jgi:transposase